MKKESSFDSAPLDAARGRQGGPGRQRILNRNAEELYRDLTEAYRSLEKLAQDVQLGREKNLAQIKIKRHQIARLKTFLRQKEILSSV